MERKSFFIYNSARLTEIDRFASDSVYNMVYRLDAMEAYNKKLVKKIAVKGITESGSTATESYVYLQGINLSKDAPTATLQFDCKTKSGMIKTVTRVVRERYNLYDHSGEQEEYRNGFVVKRIDGRDDSVEFLNGIKIYAGDVIGRVSEEQIRRLQIRETILSHLERERQLFYKGIKVLSLFFIDEVDHYKRYDVAGQAQNGIFADMFEEEYREILGNMQLALGEEGYMDYLGMIPASSTHTGYFSIDKKGRLVNSKLSHKSVQALNEKLKVSKVYFKVESGVMNDMESKEALVSGTAFVRESTSVYSAHEKRNVNHSVKYDLIGKLVEETGLTRKAVVLILKGIHVSVFEQFQDNPEEFLVKAARLINEEKATAIIQHIAYDVLDERYETDIFMAPTIKGKLGVNAMKAKKHLYDHLVYDSTNEKAFAELLDTDASVVVYVKLPDGFYISTPVGHYNPDWAIAFHEGTVKHIYFVAETKGSMSSMQLRLIEESKIHCAREHFRTISNGEVIYDVVDSYQSLLELLRDRRGAI